MCHWPFPGNLGWVVEFLGCSAYSPVCLQGCPTPGLGTRSRWNCQCYLCFYALPIQTWVPWGLLFRCVLLSIGRSLAWLRPQLHWHMYVPVLVDCSSSSGNESPQPVWHHLATLPGHLSGDPREIFLSSITPSTEESIISYISSLRGKKKFPFLEFPLCLICMFIVVYQILWLFVFFSTALYTQEVRDGNLLAVLLGDQKSVLLLATV